MSQATANLSKGLLWRRKLAVSPKAREPTYRNCIQGGVIRVMLLNKQKPYCCTEHHHVNAEATSIESGLSYSGRSDINLLEVRESAEEETTFKVQKAMSVW